jgi:four helix bundle protein
MFRFQKFDVWHKAIAFADVVYAVTRAFPSDERFGLTSQMRRAAVSVSANIAEGSGRGTDKELIRFIEIAYGSLMEVVSEAHVARNQGFLSEEAMMTLVAQADELAKMLSGLKTHIENRLP